MQQQVQLAAHRLQQLPPHRRGTGLEGLACLPPLEPVRFLLLRAPWVMRITSKGQVTIPQEIREQCGLLPHTQVRFVVEDGRVLIEKEPAAGSPGSEGLQRLRRARLRTRLSTDELLALSRGEDQP